jgi:apolipoprotein N-acyltransferase
MTFNKVHKDFIPAIQKLLLAIVSGAVMSLAFLSHEYSYCVWFGFIPLLFAIEKTTLLQSYLIGLAAGLTLFVTGAYWIVDFIRISKDYGVNSGFLLAGLFWFYSAHSIALAVLIFNWFKKHTKIHEFILFPVSLAFMGSTFPLLFPMALGNSQINLPIAIQAVEFVGVNGLDTIIILLNIIVFRLIFNIFSSSSKRTYQSIWPWVMGLSIITLWFLYGLVAYPVWDEKINDWKTLKVGLVQVNEVPRLGKKVRHPGYSQAFPPEMEMTERLSSMGAEIIVWPEAQSKEYLDKPGIKRAYQQNIKNLDSSLIFQDTQNIKDLNTGKLIKQYNTAVMIDNDGQQIGDYQKIRRIPFGEYIPLLEKDSLVKQWIEQFFGDFTSTLTQGDKFEVFKHQKINIIPLICYETTFPTFVGKAVRSTQDQRNSSVGTMLVALSNDGWFGSSHLPYQHIMSSVLRAVENRLPLVHVANNGPSIVVTPNGKVIFKSEFQKSAGYIVDVPHSSSAQGSFYSRHPSLFTNILAAIFIIILILSVRNFRGGVHSITR